MFDKLKQKYFEWKYRNDKDDYQENIYQCEDLQFIWGVKSYDDLSKSPACLYTMNDIDITYNKTTYKYFLSIETIYYFKDGDSGERQYIKELFDAMTDWAISIGIDVGVPPCICDVFTSGLNINSEFESLQELYTTFKCLVYGFCG